MSFCLSVTLSVCLEQCISYCLPDWLLDNMWTFWTMDVVRIFESDVCDVDMIATFSKSIVFFRRILFDQHVRLSLYSFSQHLRPIFASLSWLKSLTLSHSHALTQSLLTCWTTFVFMSMLKCGIYVKCQLSNAHVDPWDMLNNFCLCSNVAVYGWKWHCFFFDLIAFSC